MYQVLNGEFQYHHEFWKLEMMYMIFLVILVINY